MSSPTPPQPEATSPASSQAAQAGLAILVAAALTKLWPHLNLAELRSSTPAFKAAVVQEVQRHAQASATLAARQYVQARALAGVRGSYTPVPASSPPIEQISKTVDWALQPLWDGSVLAHAQGVTSETETASQTSDAGSAIAAAKARLAAASERLVLDTGRDTIVGNVERDRKAKGWAREVEPGACAFCVMLAARGMVYRQKSFDKANARFTGNGDAKTHDHCRCGLIPVFTAYEPTANIRRAERIWAESTKGKSGKEARKAFAEALKSAGLAP